MKREVVIIIAEDDEGHATLIMRNLKRIGISNELLHFKNGEEVLNFLYFRGNEPHRSRGTPYLLLLDLRMPKVSGVEVLQQIKEDPELSKIPVIILTTTDDPREIEQCHRLGCSSYITKPVEYDKFIEAIRNLGLFLSVVEIPKINGEIDP